MSNEFSPASPLVGEVATLLEEWFPPQLAEEWDNVGLLLGDAGRPATRIMTCLTLTAEVAQEAVDQAVDIVVTHHPIFFRPIQRLTATGPNGHLLRLAAANVAVYSPHTAYDNASVGINEQIADLLQLAAVEPIVSAEASDRSGTLPRQSGSGRMGCLPSTLSPEALSRHVAESLRIGRVDLGGRLEGTCRQLGIVCGAGASLMNSAADAGCDCLLVGEARFHDCLAAADRGLALLQIGHYESERFALESLALRLQQHWTSLECWASRSETNPIRSMSFSPW